MGSGYPLNYKFRLMLNSGILYINIERHAESLSLLDKYNPIDVKCLIIHQFNYDTYCFRNDHPVITIPDSISRLCYLEEICIAARVETLPPSISKLSRLRILDLTGCYNLVNLPGSIRAMPNLHIKFGSILSKASNVVVIGWPLQCADAHPTVSFVWLFLYLSMHLLLSHVYTEPGE